jgi:hypothetical protein
VYALYLVDDGARQSQEFSLFGIPKVKQCDAGYDGIVFAVPGSSTTETQTPTETLRPAVTAGAYIGAIAGITFVATAVFWA